MPPDHLAFNRSGQRPQLIALGLIEFAIACKLTAHSIHLALPPPIIQLRVVDAQGDFGTLSQFLWLPRDALQNHPPHIHGQVFHQQCLQRGDQLPAICLGLHRIVHKIYLSIFYSNYCYD
ncbi:hypothetical protein Haur_5288 (plasmid) [Herpetosiphon aurantiacus DSM 785]|uniref:Uncharacterized protein n=1 Tax=Herpetosiphon aurantiacus (strain ATCC 23779 / DSM 785 / 114-95) TaxID=316274 RepID=A9B9A1_HERA2|nr:hypothetical protein Haur_5288 [Herpetosiphon aurantiacus DSM 785]